MSDSTYNGWTNYETWNVKLWLDNEESTAREMRNIIRHAATKYKAEQALADYVREDMIPDLGASLAADLLGAALDAVNWGEIVESEWDELHEDDEEDEEDEEDNNGTQVPEC